MNLKPERLHAINDFSSLLNFLADELDWPIEPNTEPDELTFDYDADELKLSERASAQLTVRQLQNFRTDQPWGIFLVEFNDVKLYRTALRQVLRGLVPNRRKDPSLKSWQHDNLLFICATKDYRQFTFAHFRGQNAQRATLAMFGWQRGDTHVRTLCQFNLPALRYPANPADGENWLKQWRAAFDVEVVTDKFFAEYREVFTEVEDALDKKIPEVEARRMFTQRLFNRLMFLYFIQKKGWLKFEGRADYLRALFDRAEAAGENFYRDRLYWVFFYGMSNVGEDFKVHTSQQLQERRGEVPYLNGGLFDIEDDWDSRDAVEIPNRCFARILALFERYNFTVMESTPLDVQVAVDPEMLGKVFEELVTGRHESGSYYTPRQIVSFMCREALKHFLASALRAQASSPAWRAVEMFVDDGDASQLSDPERALTALQQVRICDPACGSGAYLLGMLQELMRLRSALFKSSRLDDTSLYARKRSIIENNLYGVDKDKFAVQIAMLRLWLSLAIESDQPQPLPNLDFKIGCGDSLTAPAPNAQDTLLDLERGKLVRLYRSLKGDFMKCNDPQTKRQLRDQIESLRNDIAVELKHQPKRPSPQKLLLARQQLDDLRKRGKQAEAAKQHAQAATLAKQHEKLKRQLAEWEQAPAENQDRPFDWAVEFAEVFLPEVTETARYDGAFLFMNEVDRQPMFTDQQITDTGGGFDIVLANPPYVQQEDIGDLKKLLLSQYKDVFTGKSDLYVCFYGRGIQLLRPNGIEVFICSNSWLDIGYGGKLQKYLLNNTHIQAIYDSAVERQFSTAKINTIISIISNCKPTKLSETNFVLWQRPFEDVIANPLNSRVRKVRQGKLIESGSDEKGAYVGDKWGGKYFRAPDIFFRLQNLEAKKLSKLSRLCKVEGYIHDNNTGDGFPEVRFIKSVKDAAQILLDHNETGVISYGVKLQGNSRVQAPILFPRTFGGRHLILWNPEGILGKEFYKILPTDKNLALSYAAQLNSTLGILQRELLGVTNLGDGALKFSADDVEKFLLIGDLVTSEVEEAFLKLATRKTLRISEEINQPDRRALDKIIFDKLGLSEGDREELYAAVLELVQRRENKAKSLSKRPFA